MGWLIFLLVFLLVLSNVKVRIKHVRPSGVCPPNKWAWKEDTNEHGQVIGSYLICEHCGPLNKKEQTE